MNESRSRFKAFVMLLFLAGLLFRSPVPAFGNHDAVKFAENAQIALRRTAHELLILNGDSTSRIPPVQQTDQYTFSIRLESLFDYEKLPILLKESLDLQGIRQGYNVSITQCSSNEMWLGYSYLDLNKKGGIPCKGRNREAGCYNLQVRFIPAATTASVTGTGHWWLLPCSALIALGFIVWKKARKSTFASPPEPPAAENSALTFGHSVLDMPNLLLASANIHYNLTYREAKLLHLFVLRPNQILDRDFILKSVWEDEGIIVGRSLDVFVSRLRKLLANDSSIKLQAVHGIGYRMEIHS